MPGSGEISGAFVRFLVEQFEAVMQGGGGQVSRDLACEIVAAQLTVAAKRDRESTAASAEVDRVWRALRERSGRG